MATFRTRLSRLERTAPDDRADRQAMRDLIQHTATVELALKPDLELVLPEDTDPVTYARIEALRLMAAGRHDEAQEWYDRYPIRTLPPPAHMTGPWASALWVTHPESTPDEMDLPEREERAIAAAKARISGKGKAGTGSPPAARRRRRRA